MSNIKPEKKSAFILVISNLIPLFGVLFWDWSFVGIIVLYWLENVVIGFLNILKIMKAEGKNPPVFGTKLKISDKVLGSKANWVFAVFFFFHYSQFVLAHGIFLFALFVSQRTHDVSFSSILIGFISLFTSHFLSYRINFIGNEEYRKISAKRLVFQPYKRVVILDLTIFLSFFVVISFDFPFFMLIVMTFLKILVDLFLHIKEHLNFQR